MRRLDRELAALRRRFQVAHSYREQATAALRQCDEAVASGRVPAEDHAVARAGYTAHLDAAVAELTVLRAAVAGHIRELDGLQPAVAEAESDAVNRLRAAYWALGTAQHAGAVGGFLDWPLDDYARGKPAPAWRRAVVRRLPVYGPAVLLVFAAFLPWLEINGLRHSLVDLAKFLDVPTVSSAYPPAMLQALWVGAVAAAFLALIAEELEGLYATPVGLAVAAATGCGVVFLPVALLRGPSVYTLVTGLQGGAFIALAACVALLAAGIQRWRPMSGPWPARGRIAGVFALVSALLFAGGAVKSLTPPDRALHIYFEAPNPEANEARIVCTNVDTEPVDVYLPWPEGTPQAGSEPYPARAYGTQVYLETEDGADRLYPDSDAWWYVPGVATEGIQVVTIQPSHSAEVYFSITAARHAPVDASRVRVVFSNRSGEALASQAYRLPSRLPAAAADPRYLPERTPSVSEPPRPEPTRQPDPAEPPPSRDEASPPEPTVPRFEVRFTGALGGRAIVYLAPEGQPGGTRRMLSAGDTLGEWRVSAIGTGASEMTLWHLRHGTVTIPRGESRLLEGTVPQRGQAPIRRGGGGIRVPD